MTTKRKIVITAAALFAVGAGTVGIAQAVGGDSDESVTGPRAEQAKQAAVQALGGGRAIEVEREDDGRSGWEVEVQRSDGSQVEVHLDRALKQTGTQADDDGAGEQDENGDD